VCSVVSWSLFLFFLFCRFIPKRGKDIDKNKVEVSVTASLRLSLHLSLRLYLVFEVGFNFAFSVGFGQVLVRFFDADHVTAKKPTREVNN
jgi:hypothetical protein